MENIFDTHAHYDDEKFDGDRDELLSSLQKSGVCFVMNCGCDFASSKKTTELCDKYAFIFGAVGIHPHEVAEADEGTVERTVSLTKHKKVKAIGEIGLDYHYDFSPRSTQLELFEKQLVMANELGLPVIIHDREAHGDTLELLKRYRPKGVVHCFSGSAEMAHEVLKIGMYIGLGGAVTFKNAKKPLEVIEVTPSDRLLLETDCPYMTPVPYRGKRNDSSLIPYSAAVIASIKGLDVQEVINIACENGKELFDIHQPEHAHSNFFTIMEHT